jgi:hypothetical protein
MSLSLNRRLIVALAISGVQVTLQVNLSLPAQVSLPADVITQLAHPAPGKVEASANAISEHGLLSALPVEDRYLHYDEVDKGADFIYSAPLENLENINSSDAKGRVKVRVLINELGIVDSATVLEAEPVDIYNGVALNALLHSRFSPAEKNGRMVKSQKILEIKFGTQR